MNTATFNSFAKDDSPFRRKVRVLLAILRRSLEMTGRAYLHGVPPL